MGLSIFVASPGDCDPERQVVRNVADQVGKACDVHLIVTGWEDQTPDLGRPQAQINPMVDECTIFIGLINRKLGSFTGTHPSGFLEEFGRARDRRGSSDEPVIALYFKAISSELLVDPGDELKRVLEFQQWIEQEHVCLYATFDDLTELSDAIWLLLIRFLRNHSLLSNSAPPPRHDQMSSATEPAADDVAGPMTSMMRVELAYLGEIQGNYDEARDVFEQYEEEISEFDPTSRAHLLVHLYRADLMILDGDIVGGERHLRHTLDRVGSPSAADRAELLRHCGHAYRFSLLFDLAERLYRDAMAAAGDDATLIAKLHTNLVETLCWSDPTRAVTEAAVAKRQNDELGNPLEQLKSAAAKAIALARLGRYDEAHIEADWAAERAHAIQYPGGTALAWQSKGLVAGLEGDETSCRMATAALQHHTEVIGTYGHLLVPVLYLVDPATAALESTRYSWIEPDDYLDRLRTVLGSS